MGYIGSSALAIGAFAAVFLAVVIAFHDLALEKLRKFCTPTAQEAEWENAYVEISDEDVQLLDYGEEQLGVPSAQQHERGAPPTPAAAAQQLLQQQDSAKVFIPNAITEEIHGKFYVTDSSTRSDAGRFGLIAFEGATWGTGRLLAVDLKYACSAAAADAAAAAAAAAAVAVAAAVAAVG
ncbi:strictosidine synthase domain-containing protein, putative [Eimeria brunetti]|uniref:Strictosidine synthase domain-containing protein, putative n=1 Tax=Eimeria brunetti TaxID=51314 RepID=U6LC19_9EIME|nr:strictosidine synthase domain-containing protein, putative [Eimeria brunetti]